MDNTTKNDIELALKVKQHKDNDSLKEIINRHTPLCVNIYERYSKTMTTSGVSHVDLLGEKDYIIYKSVLSFKPEMGVKLSTWIGEQTRYYCLNYMKNNRGIVMSPEEIQDISESNTETFNGGSNRQDLTISYVLDILQQLNDKRIIDIYKMRYFTQNGKPMTWKQIGDKLDFSAEHVRNLHNRAAEFLKNKLNSKICVDLI